MSDFQMITELVSKYQQAIHTQNENDFRALWTDENTNTLISIANKYEGINSIYQDFLINGIQASYSDINLIADDIHINFLDNSTAIVIFNYHTECIKRDTHEPYGIMGIETQVVKKIGNEWKLVHIHYSKK